MNLVNFPKPYFPLTKCKFPNKIIQVNFSHLSYFIKLIYLSGFIPNRDLSVTKKVNKIQFPRKALYTSLPKVRFGISHISASSDMF